MDECKPLGQGGRAAAGQEAEAVEDECAVIVSCGLWFDAMNMIASRPRPERRDGCARIVCA